jgi:hypothetical protein
MIIQIITFSTFVITKIEQMVTTIKKGTSREKIKTALKLRQVKIKSPDLKKYCGSISLIEDPLEMQKKWRDEWD